MTQYEYKVWNILRGKPIEDRLNDYASEGWRFVSVLFEYGTNFMIMEREKYKQ